MVARRRVTERLPARSGGRRARGVCAQLFPGLTPTSEIVGLRPPYMDAAASAALRVAVRP